MTLDEIMKQVDQIESSKTFNCTKKSYNSEKQKIGAGEEVKE